MRVAIASVVAFHMISSLTCLADQPKAIELDLRASAIRAPVLQYRLLPAESELKAGNAAPILLRLPWEQRDWMTNVFPTLFDWESRPLDDPRWANSAGVLPERFYAEMKRAAWRRDAAWEYPIAEGHCPYMILLPDVQGMRGFLAAGLSAKIRFHLSRGELDQAREGIMVGMANARHVSRTPFYVVQLVATAIHRAMLERVDELIAQPGSPNLYWALSALPDSLLNLEGANSLEADLFSMTFPAVNDFDRPRTAEEWNKMATQLVAFLGEMGEIPKQERLPVESVGIVKQLLKRFMPEEKNHLVKAVAQARADLPGLLGISEKKVAAMSDEEVGVRWYAHLRISNEHKFGAVHSLKPREAWPQLQKLQADMKMTAEKTGTKSSFLDLNSTSVYIRIWSLKRKIQALRVIEAVRHHLAGHDDRLPASLDDITDVPIPLDPLTDQPFVWAVDGKQARLTAPALPADAVISKDMRDVADLEYVLRITKGP